MTTWSDAFSTGKATLYLDISESSTNSGANTSVVSFTLRVVGNGASWNLNSGSTWSVTIDGTAYSGTWTYDFRSDNTKTLKSGTQTITHDADGSKSIAVSGTAYGLSTIGTGTITSKTFALTDFTRLPSAPGTPALSRTSNGTSVEITSDVASSPVSVTDYNYRYSTDNSGFSDPQGMGSDRLASMSVVATTPIYFQTRAYSSEGWGDWSPSAFIAGVPTAPQAINATRTARNIAINITGSASNSGSTITGYKVAYNDGTGWSTAVSMSGTTYTYTNLPAAKTYTFRVYAQNAIGTSAYTTTATGIYVAAGGKRWDGSTFASTTTAKRWDGSAWVDITTAKRWTGSAWTDLS